MGRGPIVSYFCRFWDFENFYKCLTFQWGKTLFSKSASIVRINTIQYNSGLVSEKNTLNFSLQWGAEGIRPKCDISCLFYNWSLRAGVVGSDLN